MIRTILFASALAAAALASTASLARTESPQGSPAVTPQLSKEDKAFFEDVSQGGLQEVKLGQVVVKQGASDDVKRFAQRMVDDHTKLNEKLNDAVRPLGLSAPTELDKKHQKEVDDLAKLSGPDLDKEYMSQMLSDHENDVKAFEKQAKDGKDPALRAFAASALPTLKDHLARARDIHERMKK